MTPLGLNTAAVPEAAALFPLPAAAPAAAGDAAPASSSFGDLLAASFGQQETPATTVADGAPASKGMSMADSWFATLNINFDALNASLDAEETCAAPANGPGATASLVDEADELICEDEGDEEDAAEALMALMVPIPVAVPVAVPLTEPLPATMSAADASVTSLSDLPSLSPGQATGKAQSSIANLVQASSSQSSEPAPLIAQSNIESIRDDRAEAIDLAGEQKAAMPGLKAPPAAPAETTAHVDAVTAPVQLPAERVPGSANDATTIPAQVAETPALRPSGSRVATGARAAERQPEAQVSEPLVSAPQTPLVQHPAQGQAIDVTPAVQQIERPRDGVAARLAEMSGLGQSSVSETPASAVAGQTADAQSGSHPQDSAAPEAFALGVQENAAPASPAEGGSPTPVFTVAQPHAAVAATAAVHAPEMPHASAFTNTPAPENVGRLIESMRVQIKDGIQEATVHLKPEHLGEVTISVRIERGAVSAVVHTDTHAVQQWLEAQEGKLRSGLSDQGLHLERFYVHRDGSQQPREQPRQQTQSAQRYRQQRNDQAIRFEVLV